MRPRMCGSPFRQVPACLHRDTPHGTLAWPAAHKCPRNILSTDMFVAWNVIGVYFVAALVNAQVSVAHLVRILFCICTAATIGSIGAAGVKEHLQS
jgi:hypothetical protein